MTITPQPARSPVPGALAAMALGLIAVLAQACAAANGESVVPLDVYRDRIARVEANSYTDTIEVVDRRGQPIAEFSPHGYRIWVALEEMPLAIRHAVIATEDRTFYNNAGVDKRAVARALVQNARAEDEVSGASTITMQLVRLVAFEGEERYEASLDRKLREVHLAAELDERMSKTQILEAYLNLAYFGRGAYGVEAAARRYFGVPARELGLAESAFIAGLPQAPSALEPLSNSSGARARQAVVLERLVAVGAITQEAAAEALAQPLRFVEPPEPLERRAHHFADYALSELPELVGEEVAARGGLRLRTSVDTGFTDRLIELARARIAKLEARHDVGDAALVAASPISGEIVALIGGLNYDEPSAGQVNAAASARQPGSVMKPIVYALAIESGFSPGSVLWDLPHRFDSGGGGSYQPSNYDGTYRGPVSMRQALGNSLNAATIGLAAEVGVPETHAMALRMGLPLDPDPWHYGLSIALGGGELPLIDVVGAYSAFANGGYLAGAHAVQTVERLSDGQVLFERGSEHVRVIEPATAWAIADMLSDASARRPAFPADGPLELSRPAAVKTGTSNDFRDNLTVGFTPWLTIGVWTGNKDGHPMRDVLGITGAAPIWSDAMQAAFAQADLRAGLPPADDTFERPASARALADCSVDAILAGRGCSAPAALAGAGGASGAGTRGDDPTFGWFRQAIDRDGAACWQWTAPGTGSLLLRLPASREVAASVRAWAEANGVRLASPLCAAPAPPDERSAD